MKTWHIPAREVPVVLQTDVLVVGSGPAGTAAALSAAREGAHVCLCEQCGMPGGIAAAGLMSHWTGTADASIFYELMDKTQAEAASYTKPGIGRQYIETEALKRVLYRLLDKAGVTLRLYTFACGVMMEDTAVKGVLFEGKDGAHAIAARTVIDATGDGDVALQAGVPYILGREEDNLMQPMTLMFKVGGVDDARAVYVSAFEESYPLEEGDLQTVARQHIDAPAGHVLLYRNPLPGVVTCNMTNCTGLDGTAISDLTRAHAQCSAQMEQIVQFLREHVPGYENCYVLNSAPLMGVRETRHFRGAYTLTEQDILTARVFDDWVVKGAHFNFDVHNLTGNGLDKTGVQKEFAQEQGYTIPYRCLLPEGVENLLLSGRNISGTHMAHSNFRAMPICAATGEAAGLAAAQRAHSGCSLRDVDVADIQQRLAMRLRTK